MLFFEGLRRHPTRDETLCEAVGPPRTSCQRPRCSPRSNWWAKKSRNCSCSHTISGSAQRHPFWGRMMKSHTGRCSENGTHFVPVFPLFPEATAVWQWFRFLRGRVHPYQQVLRLNLGDTSSVTSD